MKKLLLLSVLLIAGSSFGQVPNYVPTNGLLGWWPFNGNANDESGNGNDGTVNGATLTTDRFGVSNKAYDIIPGQYIGVNDAPSLNFPETDALSVSVWLYRRNSSGAIISKWGPSSDDDDEFILSRQSGGNYLFAINSSGSMGSPNFTWNNYPEVLNQWVHLTCTFDGSNTLGRIYLNSTPIYTDNTTIRRIHSTIQKLYFGRTPLSPSGYASISDMIIDDIGIWNRALTQCEISELYHAQQLTPVLALTDTTSVCAGASTTLDVGTDPAWVSYLWNTTETTQDISVSNAGIYTIEVTDTNGCIGYDTTLVSLLQPTSSSITEANCDTYTAPDGASYTVSGTYTAVIQNSVGCDSTITIDLTVLESPELFFEVTAPECQGEASGNAVVIASNGTAPYTFVWNNGTLEAENNGIVAGTYEVTVIDALGCETQGSVVVIDATESCFLIPGGLSPNGDGANETWTIGGLSQYPDAIISVFNRWGQKVYAGDYTSPPWDGAYNGNVLPTADYYYILDLGNGEKYNGVVTLKR